MSIYAHITGWGTAIPEKILTNEEISTMVDTNPEWIVERTGIRTRHIAAPEDTSATLGAAASLKALEMANVPPSAVDLVITATSSPAYVFPATASLIQDSIGATNAGAFDLSAACTGFIFALNMATQLIRSGQIKTAVVVGAETLSRYVDWTDRGTCILFGDGAGAFVLQASSVQGGVISSVMRSDGSGGDLLSVPASGSAMPATAKTIEQGMHFIKMNGREVFRFATRVMARASEEAIEKAEWRLDQVEIIIPHQANKRIIEAAARGLKLPIEKFAINVDKYGNTSTASIPIAAVEMVENGRLKKNDKTVLVGFGAGLTWGAVTVIWKEPFPADKSVNIDFYQFLARIRSFLLRVARRIEGLIWGRKAPK
ncbi:MAG: ketoacyl-ACP synthase III [Chloroflexi bacterium]|jgi:3-oxoacyl-[acyl-carrier-protein] synthase III|nr:ketoacyl-ACP synthase III [Chloroflexota bacterium]MBT3668696.1 ketoacyl-ACP synthase III [Chloroflexota bacterium]MBT4003863.1 ketoacyl-ACP synthase III [Chloroflexota bacterium]MBT4305397.1 ketoacyl-ACP synthase III [Chloroflexota bacterium]MBT4532543.1 ketoacyl-ACP synthase III [Chloroflexota bacterium]